MIANQNHFLDCICWAIVEIAARHGEFNRLNTRKEKAAAIVGNQSLIAAATTSVSSERSSLTFARTPIVETIPSFAENPEIAAATHCHLPHPRGVKIHARALPRIAIKQFSVSSTIPKEPFSNPKVERIHMITQARNRIVPAFLMKPHRRSQVCIRTVLADGMWYAGNSITNGAASPENGFVFFNMIAATRTQTIPNAYIKNAVFPASE